MLIATITTLLLVFGGGTWGGMRGFLAQMDKAARKIDDTPRKERARAVVKRMEREYEEFEKSVIEQRNRIVVVDSNYRSTSKDYRKVFLDLDNVWEESERDLVRDLLEFRKNMTREEWQEMYKALDKKRQKAKGK